MSAPYTIAGAVDGGAALLAGAGIERARAEARLLLGHALGLDPGMVFGHPERLLAKREAAAFERVVRRRVRREPLSHILGRREFWSLDLAVTSDTLDPRPDSETVIEAALDQVADRSLPLSILDLGTGSGCLMLALLSELPAARGLGIDASEAACRVARGNALRLGLADRASVVVGDWAEAIAARFDLVVANPPYVRRDHIAGLAPEVATFEPRSALDGGEDGLDAFRALCPALPSVLAQGGRAVIEHGAGQGDAVAALLDAAGLFGLGVRRDLAGIARCIIAAAARS